MVIRTPLLMHQGAHTHEKNYRITELETLPLVWAVKLFREHLLGHKTVVFTDHSACTILLKAPHSSAKIARWAMAVQDLNLEIKHRSGKSNSNADALSRNPVDSGIGSGGRSCRVKQQWLVMSKRLQRDDADCKAMLAYLEKGVLPEDSV